MNLTPWEVASSRIESRIALIDDDLGEAVATWADCKYRLKAGSASLERSRLPTLEKLLRQKAPTIYRPINNAGHFIKVWNGLLEALDLAHTQSLHAAAKTEDFEKVDNLAHEAWEWLDRHQLAVAVAERLGITDDLSALSSATEQAEREMSDNVFLFITLGDECTAFLSALQAGVEEDGEIFDTLLKFRMVEMAIDDLEYTPTREELIQSVLRKI